MDDPRTLAREVASLTREHVQAVTEPLAARIASLEAAHARIAPAGALIDRTGCLILTLSTGQAHNLGTVIGRDGAAGAAGPQGEPGPEGPAGPQGEPGERGEKGDTGESGEPGPVGEQGPAGPAGAAGPAGPQGEPGPAGPQGEPGAAGPQGEPGEDGDDGAPGAQGDPGEAGPAGPQGVKGEADYITGALIDHSGMLVLTLTNGVQKSVGPVAGRDGRDGQDGAPGQPGAPGAAGPPGLGFEDMDVGLKDDGRTLVLSFTRGDTTQAFEVALPTLVYRGLYKVDRTYQTGDVVTWAGSAFVCTAPTQDKPGEGSTSWALAVKRGQNGRDFAGPQAREVRPVKANGGAEV